MLGVYRGPRPGRTIVAIGGLHGNEPAGVEATRAVLRQLERHRPPMAGQLVGLVGNVQALEAGQRYLDRDLNRGWSAQSCARVRAARPGEPPEDTEQRELLEQIEPLAAEAPEPLVFLDLHSTSGRGAPFSIIPDVDRNRRLAIQIPLPTVLGLDEIIDGAMFGYLVGRGHMGLAVEGGQHDNPETAARLEAVIWLTLAAMGCLSGDQLEDLTAHRGSLERATVGLPPAVQILYRHGLDHPDRFRMEPGFPNFSPVRRGQVLAHDHQGPVESALDGLVMLPRYQGAGDDGFFLAKGVSRRWMVLSSLTRRGRTERLLGLWPGLDWSVSEPDTLRYAGTEPPAPMLQALRLLGYHGVRTRSAGLEFFRRPP